MQADAWEPLSNETAATSFWARTASTLSPWARRAPPPMAPELTSEQWDLAMGTLIIAGVVGFVALSMVHGERSRRAGAMKRSLSCPALVELQSQSVITACADMLVAFEEATPELLSIPAASLSPRSFSLAGKLSRTPSLPTLVEVGEPSPPAPAPVVPPKPTAQSLSTAGGSPLGVETLRLEVPPSPPLDLPRSLLVLGDRHAGKTRLVQALQAEALRRGAELCVHEGLHPGVNHLATPLIVWDAASAADSLAECVGRHVRSLLDAVERGGGAQPDAPSLSRLRERVLVFCNHRQPGVAPAHNRAALASTVRVVSGSAARGEGVPALWRLVETCAVARPKGCAPKGIDFAEAARSGERRRGRPLEAAERETSDKSSSPSPDSSAQASPTGERRRPSSESGSGDEPDAGGLA